MTKKILFTLLILFVFIQFFRPDRNISASVSPNDIANKYAIPVNVKEKLKVACYDCHSNNTRYPWYYNIQPVGWWLQHHVNEGKEELNFSEFLSYSPKKAHHKMEETVETINEGEMPLSSYTLMHRNASLSAEQAKEIVDWANQTKSTIALVNNLKPEPAKK
jgi:hypothetical protein